MDSTEPSRRQIVIGAAACAFCCAAATTKPAGRAASRPTSRPAAAGPIDAGPVRAFGRDGAYDALAKSHRVMLFRHGPKLYAASARCTHRNCALRVEVKEIQQLRCPCHDSTFDIDGIPIDGPARESLPRYAIRVDKGRVIVDPSKIFAERQWDDPSASVTLGA